MMPYLITDLSKVDFAGTYKLLCKAKSIPAPVSAPNTVESTTLEDDAQTFEKGIKTTDSKEFTGNLEKEYLDNILKDIDPDICLDENQREVILSDEDYGLVVAGAGVGKTTTVAAKVKYLVEKQHIDPSQILMISFTNKAVNELRERINRDLNIPCPIATFHSAGNAILHKNDPQYLNIVDSN